jgi:hypothetical protein
VSEHTEVAFAFARSLSVTDNTTGRLFSWPLLGCEKRLPLSQPLPGASAGRFDSPTRMRVEVLSSSV